MSNRVSIEGGGWFDLDAANLFPEDKEWSGTNLISSNTGTQWEHQAVYRTARGRWVLCAYSDYQQSPPTYTFIDDDTARDWLTRNSHDEAVIKYFGEIEEERGPGRPAIGDPVQFRLEPALLAQVDASATTAGVSRAEWIRRAIQAALS